MTSWGLGALADDVELLISEMATNAVVHGKARSVGFFLSYAQGEVRIEVDDGTPGSWPQLIDQDTGRESGRGVFILDSLARSWGTSADGRRTWCTLSVHSAVP